MGESTCLMQVQPFSYVTGFPNESKDVGNPIHEVGQSISFGRFMTESLGWEKWSSFSHHKYVEEAERYARPGSVAQKKAFFEAHYKKLAATKKAAVLIEQSQDESNNVAAGSEHECEVDNVAAAQGEANTNEYDSNVLADKSESNSVLGERSVDSVKEMEPSGATQMDNFVKIESSNQLEVVDTEIEVKDLKLSGTTQMEKPQLKSSNSNQDDRMLMSKKNSSFYSSKSSSFGRATKLPSTPARPTASSNATPINKKSALDSADCKRRSTPKSIHNSICFTPAREINRLTSTLIQKIDDSKAMASKFKASKDCSTPLRTPTTGSLNRVSKHPLATPWLEYRRDGTPHDSTSGRETVRARWNLLPTDCSKFLSACTNKLQSPNSFTPFRFRTEERAARRKEKLEKKFNAKYVSATRQKLQEQATLMEKAETEIRKLRQTLCFKARPLPEFYKERATPTSQTKKDPPPQSPKLMPSTVQRKPSTPHQRPPTKHVGSNHILEKKSQASTRSLTSRSTKITRENTSPNIQHE